MAYRFLFVSMSWRESIGVYREPARFRASSDKSLESTAETLQVDGHICHICHDGTSCIDRLKAAPPLVEEQFRDLGSPWDLKPAAKDITNELKSSPLRKAWWCDG